MAGWAPRRCAFSLSDLPRGFREVAWLRRGDCFVPDVDFLEADLLEADLLDVDLLDVDLLGVDFDVLGMIFVLVYGPRIPAQLLSICAAQANDNRVCRWLAHSASAVKRIHISVC